MVELTIPPFNPNLPSSRSRPHLVSSGWPQNELGMLKDSDHQPSMNGASYGSPSSYRTAPSRFGSVSKSIYGTPASYADVWARESGPSGEGLLKQLFASKEEESRRLNSSYPDLVRNRGLLLSAMEELDRSGKGQHVEFSVSKSIPLIALTMLSRGGVALVDSVMCQRIKLARKTMLCTRRQKLETMITEVENLQRLRHPHIVQLVGSYLQGKSFSILLYPAAEWNLASFLELC
jgi:hypothetical protein